MGANTIEVTACLLILGREKRRIRGAEMFKATLGISVVGVRHAAESLLTGRIPDLQEVDKPLLFLINHNNNTLKHFLPESEFHL